MLSLYGFAPLFHFFSISKFLTFIFWIKWKLLVFFYLDWLFSVRGEGCCDGIFLFLFKVRNPGLPLKFPKILNPPKIRQHQKVQANRSINNPKTIPVFSTQPELKLKLQLKISKNFCQKWKLFSQKCQEKWIYRKWCSKQIFYIVDHLCGFFSSLSNWTSIWFF